MNTGWETGQLGELCEILDYKRKPITKKDRIAGEYPYYGATGILGYVEGFLFDEPLVLVGEDGAKWESGESTAFAVDGKIWVNNHAHVLKPHRASLLDPWLIYHLNHLDLTEFVSGLTVPKLNQGSLREIPIPLPSLPDQRRIISILDESFASIDTAKANAEKNLQNARALFESHLQSIFIDGGDDWQPTTLGAQIHLLVGFAFKSAQYTESNRSVRLLRGDNIVQGCLRWDEVKRWPIEDVAAYERYRLREGDVVLAMDRPWVKAGLKRATITPDDLPCLLVQRTACLRSGANLDTRFLMHLIGSERFTRHILGVQTGSGVPHVSGQQIKNFTFTLPSLPEQRHIADSLETLRAETQRLESICQRKLAALGDLKKSLLHQAFSGQL